MALKLKALEKHERELLKIIENAQRKLDAIRVLKEDLTGPIIYEAKTQILTPKVTQSRDDRGALINAIRGQIAESAETWFTPRQITDGIIARGIRSRNKYDSVRATVSTTMRMMAIDNELVRRQTASKGKPAYEYAKPTISMFAGGIRKSDDSYP